VRDATAVAELPPAVRAVVEALAADQVEAMRRLAPGWSAPFDLAVVGDPEFDRIGDRLAELPCPCLDDGGRCLIYSRRPMVCRMIGLGMTTESRYLIENACPIQDRYPEYAALPPRPFPLEAAEPVEDEAAAEAAEFLFGERARADYETTIAGAIMGWKSR
jgi:Fe-S-cluster containining protein